MTRRDWWIGVTVVNVAILVHGVAVWNRTVTEVPDSHAWILWSGFKLAPQDAWLWEIDDAFPNYGLCMHRAERQFNERRPVHDARAKVTNDGAGFGFEVWSPDAPRPRREIWRCLPDSFRQPPEGP